MTSLLEPGQQPPSHPSPLLKESLSQTEGDMGSLDTAASTKVFTQTQKQTSTLLDEAGHRARGSGCEAGPASRSDQGSEPVLASATGKG